jgi:hypothetical protein
MAVIKLPNENVANDSKQAMQYFHALCRSFMFADTRGKAILKPEIHRTREKILFFESLSEDQTT